MPDDEKSLDEIAGLLDAKPAKGSDEADDAAGENDNSTELEGADEHTDDNSEGDAGDSADEETGEEPGEGEEGEADDKGGSDAEGEEPLFTVTLDGKEVKVTRAEAIAGYQRQADYTRKTQELATQRQAAEAEVAQYRQNREQYASILTVLQERVGSEKDEPTEEQWNTLQSEDPERFALEWANATRRKEQRAKIKAEQDRIAGEKAEEQKAALVTFITEQRTKLLEALPEWKTPEKATAGMARVREYGKTLGFTDKELDQAYDHRMIVAVDKARRYDALMAEKKRAMSKVEKAPDMPAPGNRTPPKNTKIVAREAARKELRKTGKLEDALSLLDA